MYLKGGIICGDVIRRDVVTLIKDEIGVVDQGDVVDLALVKRIVWCLKEGEMIVVKRAVGDEVLCSLGKVDSKCVVFRKRAGGDDVVVVVCFDGVDACVGVLSKGAAGDGVVGCVLEFDAVAVLGEGAVGDGVVDAGVVFCSEEDDSFVLAVLEGGVGDGV